MSTIAAEFSKLRHENGDVDVQRRKSELTALVDALDAWELLHLRTVLQQRRIELASPPQLPAELLMEIVTYLEPMDLVACASVCRSWRLTWTSECVVRDCARFFFPGFVETTAATNPKGDLWSAFLLRVERRSRRSRGAFTFTAGMIQRVEGSASLGNSSFFVPDPDAHPDGCIRLPHEPRDRQFWTTMLAPLRVASLYSHGRVATDVDACCVFLDDIVKRRRRLVSWPEGRLSGSHLAPVVLTEKLLVFEIMGKRALVVYHIDVQEFRKIVVPCKLARVWAHHTTVNITAWSATNLPGDTSEGRTPKGFSPKMLNGDIAYIWRWGEPLREIQALQPATSFDPGVTTHGKKVKDVIIEYGFYYHPWRNDISFRATNFTKLTQDEGLVDGVTVVVEEIVGHTARNRFTYNILSFASQPPSLRHHQQLCRPENSHGENTIYFAHSDDEDDDDPGLFVRVSFNTVTKEFSERSIRLGDGYGFNMYSDNLLGQKPAFWDHVLHAYPLEASGIARKPSVVCANLEPPDLARSYQFGYPGDFSRLETEGRRLIYDDDSMLLHSDDENLILTTRFGYVVWSFSKCPEAEGGDWVPVGNMSRQQKIEGSGKS